MRYESDRGRILPPNLDDRTWQDLVDEMTELARHYAPAWTDHGPGDVGTTLIELFAWLGESVIYRLNRVPEKNYLAFLNLIGATRNPPSPAAVHLTFTSGTAVEIPAGTMAQTAALETQAPVVFETDERVRLVPANLKSGLLVTPAQDDDPSTYAPVPVTMPADRFPVVVPSEQTLQLCFGFDRSDGDPLDMRFRLYRALAEAEEVSVEWCFSKAPAGSTDADPFDWPLLDEDSDAVLDGTDKLQHDGTITLRPPKDWSRQRPSAPESGSSPAPPDTPVWSKLAASSSIVTDGWFWFGVRLTNSSPHPVEIGFDRVLHNAAIAHAAPTVRNETLGVGTGLHFQTLQLANRPVFRAPTRAPYGHVQVTVTPRDGDPEPWSMADDIPAGPANCYRLNPVTGEIAFGDHDPRTSPQGHGSMPPIGASITARYRHVTAGASGNVAPGNVVMLDPGARLGGVNVANQGAGYGGTDEEPIDVALRRAPEELRIRDRAVTADDIEYLAAEASNEVRIVRCLTPMADKANLTAFVPWQYAKINRAPGVVNVIVVPDLGLNVPRPEPTPDLLQTVEGYLDQRRDVTARIFVRGPVYLPILVSVEIKVWQEAVTAGVNIDNLEAETRRRLAEFLHPVRGGPDGRGWQVGQHIFSSDVYGAVVPSEDVGFVSALLITAERPPYFGALLTGEVPDPGEDAEKRPFVLPQGLGTSVRLADYELVCGASTHKVSVKKE